MYKYTLLEQGKWEIFMKKKKQIFFTALHLHDSRRKASLSIYKIIIND